MIIRRNFLQILTAAGLLPLARCAGFAVEKEDIPGLDKPADGESVVQYVRRGGRAFDNKLYAKVLGAANEFKEGDEIIGVAATSPAERWRARQLLGNTLLSDVQTTPPYSDQLYRFIQPTAQLPERYAEWTFADLHTFLLQQPAAAIHTIKDQLSSDVIGCVVKLCSNADLITIAQKIFNPLPGTQIGAAGYLGARIQPNSPTDHVDDILWQVLSGWSYGVGDVLLGTNPVSSEPTSVATVQAVLRDVIDAFGLEDTLPHCVLSHIDVQAEVEEQTPGSTALWFQSIAGTDTANATFDIDLDKMVAYARRRTGKYGLYFETGQGADFTNGHSHGFDMVLHESRKYGFARKLQQLVAEVNADSPQRGAWVHLNDVAGFIGPEVFRTREQLVRCCLEDIVMGKLHGLCIGLDVCSTLHMDVSLSDLDWCLDQIMPANPAYLMALPTKIDPMLGYLTTGFQDHVRLRKKFGFRVNDAMQQFFEQLGVMDAQGEPAKNFGDPNALYLQYRRRRGDSRRDDAILAEGRSKLKEIRERGVFIAEGHGKKTWDLRPTLATEIDRIYSAAKKSIWAEWNEAFLEQVPDVAKVNTKSGDREDYILHPESGESLPDASQATIDQLRARHAGKYDVQLVISDGLNALAIMNTGQLLPFVEHLRRHLAEHGYRVAPDHLAVRSGRVRAGYRIGEQLFGRAAAGEAAMGETRTVIHVIGERPGTGHDTFSAYLTKVPAKVWAERGKVDHNLTKVVSGIALTALPPRQAAEDVVRVLQSIV